MSESSNHRSRLESIARRAMVEHGLEPEIPEAARSQAASAAALTPAPSSLLRDLRSLLWASIDNDDSRDLDQLSVAEPLANHQTRILIAIADVDALVTMASPADRHARTNTTSVYTPAVIFPMLPERFSTDLTSLGEHQDRLAIVVALTMNPDGTVAGSDVFRAVVRNQAKLAYNSVATWLDGQGPLPAAAAAVPGLDEQLRLQDRVAQAMKAWRHQHGALTLDTLSTRAIFEGDVIAGLRPDDKNRAKQLIEDFMIAANAATARYLSARGLPSIRRVLKTPERWPRIVELAKSLGERLPAEPSAPALEAFLNSQRQRQPAHFPDLSLSVIKLLGSGEYAVRRPTEHLEGHFGLAVADYSHSTAPNRRYPDLATQRLLKAALAGTPSPYSIEALGALAEHCTLQEDNATKVERQVRKSAAALFLSTHLGQEFDAIVTGASAKGTWVRAIDPPIEGRVVRGFEGLDVGDRVRVRLLETDVERGFIDFETLGRHATR